MGRKTATLELMLLALILFAGSVSSASLTPGATQAKFFTYYKGILAITEPANSLTSSDSAGDYANLYAIRVVGDDRIEYKFTAATGGFIVEGFAADAGDQVVFKYNGTNRIAYFSKIATMGDSISDLYIASDLYPELAGYYFEVVNANCKTSFTATEFAGSSSNKAFNGATMIEVLTYGGYADKEANLRSQTLAKGGVIIQKALAEKGLTIKNYNGASLLGWKHPELVQSGQNLVDMSYQMKCSMVEYSYPSSQNCGCLKDSYTYLDDSDACKPLGCTSPLPIYNSLYGGFCACADGEIWNPYSNKCELISTKQACLASNLTPCGGKKVATADSCKADPLSTGTFLSDIVQCQCTTFAFWDDVAVRCSPYCYMDSFSTGKADGDSACICKDHFTWSASKAKCVLDCSTIAGSTKQPKGDFICECAAPAVWNFSSLTCDGDCSSVLFSKGTVDAANGGCVCVDKFAWNTTKKTCEIDCSSASDLSDGKRIAVNQCGCNSGAVWSFDALDCLRNCSAFEFATGLNLNAHDCICEDGYKWLSDKLKCQLDCGQRPGELNTFNDAEGYCDCDDSAFFFSYQLGVCAIDCSKKLNTRQSLYPSALACECVLGYAWNASKGATGDCSLACNGPFDTGSLDSNGKCACETKAFFDSFSNACTINCRVDTLSTKTFTGSACVCKDNAEWKDSENACKCKTGFTFNSSLNKCESSGAGSAAVGAVAGVVSTSVAVLIGKLIHDRRAKKEEGAQEEGKDSRQSQQGLKVEELVQ